MKYDPSYECPHCGRVWTVRRAPPTPQALKLMLGGIKDHQKACSKKTPEQRREVNRRDEQRWSRMGQSFLTRCVNNPSHPGLHESAKSEPPAGTVST